MLRSKPFPKREISIQPDKIYLEKDESEFEESEVIEVDLINNPIKVKTIITEKSENK